MYLKSIVVEVKGLELEFSYPKIISKNEIEYMAMSSNHLQGKQYVYDKEGRVILRNSPLKYDTGRNFIIKPIARKDSNLNYTFYVNVFEKVGNNLNLITEIKCPLTMENKKKINNTFAECVKEIKQKINSVKKSEIIVWAGGYEDFDENTCKESIFCYPTEVFNNKGKEYWEVESFIDADYLERLLESSINKEYGFSNMFKMLDLGLTDVIKTSKFTLNISKILKKMNELNNCSTTFVLESIVMPK